MMKISIRSKLIGYFMAVILVATLLCGLLVNSKVTDMLEANMKLTSEQTLTETLKNFQTYLKSLSIPVDLITRKKEVKKLELEGDFDTNVSSVQDSLVASLKVVENPVRCYYSTASGYHISANLYDDPETGKVKSNKTLEEGVDNTAKVWYTNCLENKSRQNIFAMFTEPYVDEETGEKIITVSQGIRIDDVQTGAVALDISFSTLEKYVQEIKLLNTGYVILVDAEGNILVDNENNTYISDTVANNEFWNQFTADSAQETEVANSVYSYTEQIAGNTFYVTVLEDEITNWKLIGFICSEMENANNISQMVQSIVVSIIVALIIGTLIAVFVAFSFSKAINKLQTATAKLADGDFSDRIKVTRKDELGDLQENFNSMVDSVSGLIREVGNKFSDVYHVAGDINEVSLTTKETANQVTMAIQSVAVGATEQAQSAQEANTEVDNLANSLEETREYVQNIDKMSKEANELSSKGINVVGELVEKTDKTRENSKVSGEMIGEMLESIDKINYISDAIADITSQTNLLSLNASIEAARAGELGKGFAVVADEIRKLAEQSKDSTDEIKAIVMEISEKSAQVSGNLEESNRLQQEQEHAIHDTRELFHRISEAVDNLIKGLEQIGKLNNNMVQNKETVVESMENIASISEESAAAAEQVTASAELVNTTMEDVSDYAQKLNKIATELKDTISRFKL